MSESQALVPIDERTIDFYGDEVIGVIIEEDGERRIYVPVRPICDYLGLSWAGQRERIMRDEVLAESARFVRITRTAVGRRTVVCLPLDFLPGWLFGISFDRVRPELRPALKRYRRECFRALAQAFSPELVIPQLPRTGTAATSSFPGFVYVAHAGSLSKIGATSDVRKRIQQLDSALPFSVSLQHTITTDDMFVLERELHALYQGAGRHFKGEWFSLTEADTHALQSIEERVTHETMPAVLEALKSAALFAPAEVLS